MLDLACYNGYTECVETLLLQGATILVHDNITRRTPLHAAGMDFSMSEKCFIRVVKIDKERSFIIEFIKHVWQKLICA